MRSVRGEENPEHMLSGVSMKAVLNPSYSENRLKILKDDTSIMLVGLRLLSPLAKKRISEDASAKLKPNPTFRKANESTHTGLWI